MSDWIGANWIWILLGIGVLWFMFRRGGMGCGMGGHGGHGEDSVKAKELPASDADVAADHSGHAKTASTRESHRHGGCC